jgi:tetratricopeptide (TPR) repeat protein
LLASHFSWKAGGNSSDPRDWSLGVFFLAPFLGAFWVDPELGAVRDWDLLSIYGFPIVLWGLYRYSRTVSGRFNLRVLTIPALLVTVVQIGPNVYEKTRSEPATARLDTYLWDDPHYQTSYEKAFRCSSWGIVLTRSCDRKDLAEKYYRRRLSADSTAYQVWVNLAQYYSDRGILDSAASFYEKGSRGGPNRGRVLSHLARVEMKLGKLNDALAHGEESVQLEPDDPFCLTTRGVTLAQAERYLDAAPFFRRAYDLDATAFDHVVNMSAMHSRLGSRDSAFYYGVLALPLADAAQKIELYSSLSANAVQLGLYEEARKYLDLLRLADPDSPRIEPLEQLLREARKR